MKGLEEISVKEPKISTPVMPEGAWLVDTHCHLDMEAFAGDLDAVLDRAKHQGIASIITIGIDLPSSQKAIEIAQHHPGIHASVGLHPHDVQGVTDKTYTALLDLIDSHREQVVAYGEIGLDYVKIHSEPDLQRRHFRLQLEMAKDLQLPVIIHDREAHDDTLRILQECGPFPHGGVMHCFSGDCTFAEKIIALGFHISIPGVVTFKSATDMQDVARNLPLSALLLETDGPFLAPHPRRGKRNEPSYILHTAAFIARLRDIALGQLARVTTAHAHSLFHLNIPMLSPESHP